MAEIFWLNVKGYKIIVNATAHIKKLYTNLIQNEQSNIIIYIIFYFFFPFGMKNLIYNLPRLSFSKSLQINVFQCSGNHNCILSVTKKIKKGKFCQTKYSIGKATLQSPLSVCPLVCLSITKTPSLSESIT